MLNTTSFLILNCRFEAADNPIPYTLQRQDEATINDYNFVAKPYFSKVKTCYVIPRPSRTLRSKSGPPTDHNPIVLHLLLLAKSTTQGTGDSPIDQQLPPRTQFHSSTLKDVVNRKNSQMLWRIRLAKQNRPSSHSRPAYSNRVSIRLSPQKKPKIIGTTEFRGKKAQTQHLTQRRQQENTQ